MTKKTHVHLSDLQGLSRLSIEAIAGLTRLVEALHHSIARKPGVFGTSPSGTTSGITGFVYRSIQGVTALVGGGLDATFAQLKRLVPLVPALGARLSSPEREAVLAALNGVLGDYLADTHNPLAIPMRLRRDGQPLMLETQALAAAVPQPTGKLLVLVHGLCMNDLQWARPTAASRRSQETAVPDDSGHAARLARDLGYTPIYLHYNSGRHISSNGREFDDLMEALVSLWPVPLTEVVMLTHSMGGLVARSACHYGAEAGHDWLRYLRRIFFLGTPHHGAPLERGGNWVDILLGVSPYTAPFARLGKIRSAGITDLRYGNLVDEDWQGHDRFSRSATRPRSLPLPKGVLCYAIAATTVEQASDLGQRLLGDGLVPVNSALGLHDEASLSLKFPASRLWVAYGMNHLDLLNQTAAIDRVRRWLAPRSRRAS